MSDFHPELVMIESNEVLVVPLKVKCPGPRVSRCGASLVWLCSVNSNITVRVSFDQHRYLRPVMLVVWP
jgi:hypothetical protein